VGRIAFSARLFLVLVAFSLSETARIVEPASDSSLVYFHDVLLWVLLPLLYLSILFLEGP